MRVSFKYCVHGEILTENFYPNKNYRIFQFLYLKNGLPTLKNADHASNILT